MIVFTSFNQSSKKQIISLVFGAIVFSIFYLIAPFTYIEAESIEQSQALDIYNGDTSHPVKFELQLLSQYTRLLGEGVVTDMSKDAMSIIETVYHVRARAFGGDVYLPTYQEQIISEPVFVYPELKSNAVILGTPSIVLSRTLEKKGDKFILREYESVDMDIKVSLKILHAYIPDRLVLRNKLNALAWYPTVYQNGLFDQGIDTETGQRLVNIPLINATYIPEQITRVDWQSEPVVLVKGGAYIQAIKNELKENGSASIIQIIRRLFK